MTKTRKLAPPNLSGFTPTRLSARLHASSTTYPAPASIDIPGAVLSIDICGSSAFAHTATLAGINAPDFFLELFNRRFGHAIRTIDAQGGDVVKIVGDGLICFWPQSSVSPEACLNAAVATAGSIVRLSRPVERKLPGLPWRGGIAYGSLKLVEVGGVDDFWEILPSGATLERCEAAMQEAAPNTTTIAACAQRELLEAKPARAGRPPPHAVASRRRIVSGDSPFNHRYIPPIVHRAYDSEQNRWPTVVTEVTTVFGALPNDAQSANRAVRVAQRVIGQAGGEVLRIGTDDKGPAFLAVFGLLASEVNHATRSVRAALDLSAVLSQLDLASKIGLASGPVIAGTVGNDIRREYTVIGESANIAAQLMTSIDSGIICTESTQRLCAKTVAWHPPVDVFVGRAKRRVAAFRPQGFGAVSPSMNHLSTAARDRKADVA